MNKTRSRRVAESLPEEKRMVDWAAPTLARFGCTLHAAPGGGWDVELPGGAWEACNSARELADLAHKIGTAKNWNAS